MQTITKNIRWRPLIEMCKTTTFDLSSNNMSWDFVLTSRFQKNKKAKTLGLHLHGSKYKPLYRPHLHQRKTWFQKENTARLVSWLTLV